jgi:outer membrane lipoprotein SlyB
MTFSVLLLAGCVSVPAGPSLQAQPGSRKSYEQFVADDRQCRSIAVAQIGGTTPSDAANQSAAASAAAGTAIGAVTGAMIDGSSGAAAGAGIGLLFGAMAGSATSYDAYTVTQQRYDSAYYVCMYARGHKVPVPAHDVARYRARYDSVVPRAAQAAPLPPPPDYAPPDYRPPSAPAPKPQ